MPGLDQGAIDILDGGLALRRVRTDVASDFVLAPHFRSVYEYVGEELWDEAVSLLRSGQFEPALPIVEDVPKLSGVTRPGAILPPHDRIIYQALVDAIAPVAEAQIDRGRAYGHVLLDPDPTGSMFASAHDAYERMRTAVQTHCEDPGYTHALRADVAAYFERLNQHNLINLLHATGCRGEIVNLLEKVLLAWTQKQSYGILQGMFPSDFLGNFYLCALDAELEVQGRASVRLLDDIYMFFDSERSAREGLVQLCRSLRSEGLHLNERKTSILESERLLFEETQLDRMFDDAREEAEANALAELYGFIVVWNHGGDPVIAVDDGEELPDPDVLELTAVEALFEQVTEPGVPAGKIERFCLPLLAQAKSTVAISRAIDGLGERPHLAQVYASYLVHVGGEEPVVVEQALERLLELGQFGYDWQSMWILGALTYLPGVTAGAVTNALRIAQDRTRSTALRAVAVVFVGRNGNAAQRRALKNLYANEPSEYVRAAILYAARYFPTSERRTCIRAWGGHSSTNSLVARALQAELS